MQLLLHDISDTPWPCKNGDGCVYNEHVCDGYKDCNDNSDESPSACGTYWTCPAGLAKCYDEYKPCVPKCNRVTDCLDGSDEANCEWVICPGGHRKCQITNNNK